MKSVPTLILLAIVPTCAAQPFEIDWYTIDGGGTSSVSGGSFELAGTIGQHDAAATLSGGVFDLSPGFWAPFATEACPADFNGDGTVNTLDFLAFLNAFNAGDPNADFNGDGSVNTLDFLAFLNAFNGGC